MKTVLALLFALAAFGQDAQIFSAYSQEPGAVIVSATNPRTVDADVARVTVIHRDRDFRFPHLGYRESGVLASDGLPFSVSVPIPRNAAPVAARVEYFRTETIGEETFPSPSSRISAYLGDLSWAPSSRSPRPLFVLFPQLEVFGADAVEITAYYMPRAPMFPHLQAQSVSVFLDQDNPALVSPHPLLATAVLWVPPDATVTKATCRYVMLRLVTQVTRRLD